MALAASPAGAIDRDALARLEPGMRRAEVARLLGLTGEIDQLRFQNAKHVERWAVCWHEQLGDVPVGMGDFGPCEGTPDGELMFRDDVLVAIQHNPG